MVSLLLMRSRNQEAGVLYTSSCGHCNYSRLGGAERQEPESKAFMKWGTKVRTAADSDEVAGFITRQYEPQRGRH